MGFPELKPDVDFGQVAKDAISRVNTWTERSQSFPTDRPGKLLSDVLQSEGGLDFTVQFVDKVIRPEDKKTAARNLKQLSNKKIDFLPPWLTVPAKVGGSIAPASPKFVVNSAFRVFRALVGDLVLDTTPKKLGPAVRKMREDGSRLNLNLLGEAVLGQEEARRRLKAVMDLLDHDFVDYVSIKVSSVLGVHNPWGYEHAVDEATNSLLPLYKKAAEQNKFVNLDMEEYHDLHMTIEVFKRMLGRPEFKNLRAGIVLQAYLPDAYDAMADLQQWAAQRVADGGAPIKVRLVKGANLPMERVDAAMHGWDLTIQPTKAASDANYLRVLEYALRPEHIGNVELGIAGHNLFSLGFALSLAEARGITKGYDVEMLKGMATNQALAIREDVGSILYYVPVVDPREYDVAISYLVRRLEESAANDNFMSAVFHIAEDQTLFERERDRYANAVAGAFPEVSDDIRAALPQAKYDDVPELFFGANRSQNRMTDDVQALESFANVADSDPSLPANLEWANEIFAKIPDSQLGIAEADAARVRDAGRLSEIIGEARGAAAQWAARPAKERADLLRNAGKILGERRAQLIEVAASECGKVIGEGDIEVSEAIDFCNYYADLAEQLDELDGVRYEPVEVTAAIPPWNFPIAIPCGSAVAPLATGSAVIFKPAEQARRCGAILAEALWDAGIPREVLHFVDIDPEDLDEVGKALVTQTDQTVLTGSIDTAQLFRSWKPDLRIFAETSGKNSIIVTPQADIDLAAKDVVNSAFGHAGQKCSACSLVILVGAMADSERFQNQIVDAARSLVVGWPETTHVEMGPVIEPAEGKLKTGLTELGDGERWLLEPKQLDDTGRLWSPGIRTGVKPGSHFHMTEFFGPILGIIRCETLDDAIEIQNAVEFGLTGGIHSLDSEEIARWLGRVDVGNVYINRGITGAIVRRQPFGGWKRSQVGTGGKAGGPNHLIGLGRVYPDTDSRTVSVADMGQGVLTEADKLHGSLPLERQMPYRGALRSMAAALDDEFLAARDVSQLGVEKNVFRYRPTDVHVRVEDQTNWEFAYAMIVGAIAGGAKVSVSVADELPGSFALQLYRQGAEAKVEDHETWIAAIEADPLAYRRIRYIGDNAVAVSKAVDGSVDVAIYADEVTGNGRVDLRPFFLEQAVAATNHRFGDKTHILDGVI